MSKILNVIFVDPWGINNTEDYTCGIVRQLDMYCDLILITNTNFDRSKIKEVKVYKWFFKFSQNIKRSIFRKYLRGVEYIVAWIRILLLLKRNKPDILHINWLLMYGLDILFLKIAKHYVGKIVYTAHNILPHVNGGSYYEKMARIYNIVDNIVVHGKAIKREFKELYPNIENKVMVMYHGANLKVQCPDCSNETKRLFLHKFNKMQPINRIFIFFGHIFFEKGVDRIISNFNKISISKDDLFIIMGREDEEKALAKQRNEIFKNNNILFLSGYVSKDILDVAIKISNFVVMPYRHASMSGVIFTCAEYRKPVVVTNVGAIPEYLENSIDSLIVENDDISIINGINKMLRTDKETLEVMGNKLTENIMTKFSWSNSVNVLVNEIYNKK